MRLRHFIGWAPSCAEVGELISTPELLPSWRNFFAALSSSIVNLRHWLVELREPRAENSATDHLRKYLAKYQHDDEAEGRRRKNPNNGTKIVNETFFALDVEKLWRQLEFERWNGGKKYERNKNSLLLVRNAILAFYLLEFYFGHDLMYREPNSLVNCANFRLKYQQ